ncbi:MAG: RNA 2',3'-cyclic phosphodiesterase [Gemmatimonadota bacterium]
MRLFVALNLPKKERQRIHRAARPLREGDLPVRWVDPDNFHLTLKFLGQVHTDRVDEIADALNRVSSATPTFSVALQGFGAFPSLRRPRVLWLGVEATPELRCLKQDLEWALGDCGFEAETRAFHPHLTMGRADERGGAGAFRGFDEMVADIPFQGRLNVRSLDLMRSHLSSQGARYSVLHSARLAAST